jgi:hypothetical protein
VVHAGRRHVIDLSRRFRASNHVAYAFTYIVSDRDQTACFDAGMNDGGKIFVNGKEVYRRFSPLGQACKPGIDPFEAPLKKGLNPVLLKVEDGGGKHWEFVFEVYGEDGEALSTRTSSD